MLLFLFLVLYMVSFLSIGLWLALKATGRGWLPKEFLYIGSVAASLTIYYVIYYFYLLSPSLTSNVAKFVIFLSLVALAKLLFDFKKSRQLFATVQKYFVVPLLITAAVMFAYSTVFFSCVTRQPALAGYNELDNRTFCHTSSLPFDNSLGYIFGNNVLRNEDKKQAIDWNMVDRPPLEIAATLPILDRGAHYSPFTQYYAYYVFSIFLQLSWVGAFWGALQVLKIDRKFQLFAFVALAATGFFYINSVFVWPKLLAASMVFSGIFILLGKQKSVRYRYLPFSALTISLGVLSHSAVLFTVLPFAVYYLYEVIRIRKIDLRYFGVALAIGLLMLAPWYTYKNSVTKTDRLSKWFFAGVESGKDKRGTLETIRDQYKTLSFDKWLSVKKQNAETLFTGNYKHLPSCSLGLHSFYNKCIFMEWRTLTFYSTFFAFEVLILGWVAVIYQFIRRKMDLLDKELVLLIAGTLVFWVIITFQAGLTIVHAGSYATMMLGFLLIIKKLAELPRILMASISVAQVAVFYLSWIAPYLGLAGVAYIQHLPR